MKSKNEIQEFKKILKQFYAPEFAERCGFICGNSIIEVKNAAEDPLRGFFIGPEDVIKHTEEMDCWASWHTHPGQDSNLSGGDHLMFKQWPDFVHLIIGSDGVKCYKWDSLKKAVLEI